MIKSKCKVRFTAAEVDDSQSAAGRQVLEDIVDDFKIPVYLAEFTVGRGKTFPSEPITPSSMRKSQGVPSGIIYCFVLLCERDAEETVEVLLDVIRGFSGFAAST